jgi:AmpD protein
LVVHNISLPPESFGGPHIEALFANTLDPSLHPYFETLQGLRVSSHFLLRRDGEVIQFVSCNDRAWHAGVSVWRGQARCNDYSIGIELEGSDHQPFEAAQYAALAGLCQVLMARYPLAEMVGHSDIAPGRKTDPGPYFDWGRIRSALLVTDPVCAVGD